MQIQSLIRTIPDYPKTGIPFRDITTLLQDANGFAETIHQLSEVAHTYQVDVIAGIEARGFIIGAALAKQMGVGFVPIRKAGKLPAETISQTYALEYGEDQLELHIDAIEAKSKVLLVDDLIATGGTAIAAIQLIRQLQAEVSAAAFVIDLPDLGGMQRLTDLAVPCHALCAFAGE